MIGDVGQYVRPRSIVLPLPGASTAGGAAASLAPPARDPPVAGERRRDRDVLVVEDEEIIREQLAELLRFEGYTVVTAANGREALDLLGELSVKVMVLDLMLPVMSGWELLGEINRRPELASLPVLTVTAVTNAHRAPGGPLFLKPINVDSLLRAVSAHVDGGWGGR